MERSIGKAYVAGRPIDQGLLIAAVRQALLGLLDDPEFKAKLARLIRDLRDDDGAGSDA